MQDNRLNFKYVIFGYKRDYFRTIFDDAIESLGIEYISSPIEYTFGKGLLSYLYGLHTNDYLNKIINLPFKDRWFRYFYTKTSELPVCFIFLMSWCNKKYELLYEVLRNNYPGCKLCLYLEDLIASRTNYPCDLFDKFDLVISYDKKEAQRLNCLYYHNFLSEVKNIKTEYHSDFCFVGRSKDRDTVIYELYDYLINEGFVCDFVLTGAPKSERIKEGIKYLDHDMSYKEYLSHILGTECIVEIMHHDAEGYTLRTWESYIYNKKLLTNNKGIKDFKYYTPSRICATYDKRNLHDFLELQLVQLTQAEHKEFSSIGFIEKIDEILKQTI